MTHYVCGECGANFLSLADYKDHINYFCPETRRPEAVRGATHGDYTEMSRTAQAIKDVLHASPNWSKMAPHLRESLDLSATKMARIVHGDFSCYDHWDDLRGYPQLVLDRMVKPKA